MTDETLAAFNKIWIDRALSIENQQEKNLTAQKAVFEVFNAIKNDYKKIYFQAFCGMKPMETLQETIEYVLKGFKALDIAFSTLDPTYREAITYTHDELLNQGFDENGNFTRYSPFVLDSQNVLYILSHYANITATKEITELLQRAIQNQLNKEQICKEWKAEFEETDKKKDDIKPLPHYTTQRTDHLLYPLDKPNGVIWRMQMILEENQKLQLAINTNDQHPEAIVDYGIDFDFDKLEGLTITKELTTYDKRVYVAAAALFNAGNDVFSVHQIHKAMGNAGEPALNQIQQINDSLTKMGAARISLDNQRELKVNKGYKKFKYDGYALPFERISAYINGVLTDAAIHLFREPPLITFARERRQITSLPRTLLQSPISKTKANLTIEDYLLRRISPMNRPKSKMSRKILFSTIYEECGITDKKQKQRATPKIKTYLDHYKKSGLITGYTTEKDGVTIQPKKTETPN